jgi:hypothetical protein
MEAQLTARRSSPFNEAVKDMEEIAHWIGLLAGLQSSGRVERLAAYLVQVGPGAARTPIGLHLTPPEVLEFLKQLGPAMKAAIHLHDLALARPEHPDGDPP